MQKSGFFDSNIVLDSDGNETFDREYSSSDFTRIFNSLFTNGIKNLNDNLRVSPTTDLSINIQPGFAMINGRYYELETIMNIP